MVVNTTWLFSPVVRDTSDVCWTEWPSSHIEDVSGTWGRYVSQAEMGHAWWLVHPLYQWSTCTTGWKEHQCKCCMLLYIASVLTWSPPNFYYIDKLVSLERLHYMWYKTTEKLFRELHFSDYYWLVAILECTCYTTTYLVNLQKGIQHCASRKWSRLTLWVHSSIPLELKIGWIHFDS